jgi:hypothetical protein
MLTDEIRSLLQRPLIARIALNTPDGFPHIVPIWYELDGDDLVFISDADTRKVRLIDADPRGSVSIGGDVLPSGEIAVSGYLFKGRFSHAKDEGFVWLKRMCYRYEERERAERDIAAWSSDQMRVVRFKIEKVIKVA